MSELAVQDDLGAACARLAADMASGIHAALHERGSAHVSLAGGESPRHAYELLADMVDGWQRVHLWYGDERCVDPEDEQSNHHMVARTLLAGIARRGEEAPDVHRIEGERGPDDAATAYARELRRELGDRPALDVAVLGLGPDGHTASLFPGHPQVSERDALCVGVTGAPKPPPDRVTLTLPALNGARRILLLATGAQKADALEAVLAGPDEAVPASLLDRERLLIIADRAAAP